MISNEKFIEERKTWNALTCPHIYGFLYSLKHSWREAEDNDVTEMTSYFSVGLISLRSFINCIRIPSYGNLHFEEDLKDRFCCCALCYIVIIWYKNINLLLLKVRKYKRSEKVRQSLPCNTDPKMRQVFLCGFTIDDVHDVLAVQACLKTKWKDSSGWTLSDLHRKVTLREVIKHSLALSYTTFYH